MTPRRVALVVGQLQMGGAERQLFELATRLDGSRYEPLVVCLSEVTEPFATRLRQRGVPVSVLPRSGHGDLGRALRLCRIFRARDVRLAHSFLLAANAYTWTASRLAGFRPYIASSRTCIPPRTRWARLAHRRAFRSARAVIVNSRKVLEFTRDLYRLDARTLRVVPNGVDLELFAEPGAQRAPARHELGVPDEAMVVGCVGRLSPEKNLRLWLEMAAGIAGLSRLRFVLVGDGPEMRELRARAGKPDLRGLVVFAGGRDDVARLLPAFDVFVSSSDTEGMPNAVMEAMAAGLPVVATRAGGTDEVVEDRETGFVVERGDLRALVDRVSLLIADPAGRRRMGRQGRERIEREFSVARMVSRTTAVYDEVLE